jgi:hypothetical protein
MKSTLPLTLALSTIALGVLAYIMLRVDGVGYAWNILGIFTLDFF